MHRAATRFAVPLLLACALAQGTASALVIDGGVDNTFAISTSDGTLWAWGGNVGGKLGNGTTMNTSMPVPVSERAQTGIAAGFYHTCAWNQGTGAAHCWGQNGNGQLGNDPPGYSLLPVPVSGLSSGVMSMAAGTWHTCAVTDDGAVKCWGNNAYGQVGVPGGDSHVPVEVLPGGIAAIAAGEKHTCALTTFGAVKCWGTNDSGQLGTGSPNQQLPADVPGLSSGVAAITAGVNHTCALTTAGAVLCWGANNYGQLGINSAATSASSPTALPDLTIGVVAIAAGSYHTCAILTSGTARCWGLNNAGQLGDNSQVNRIKPFTVQVLSGPLRPVAIQAGFNHTCAVTVLRQVFCWGSNTYGEVGDDGPPATPRLVPTPTQYMGANVANLGAGGLHACSVYNYPGNLAYLFCWGHNAYGEVGDNTNVDKHVPTGTYTSGVYPYPLYADAVSAGMSHTLALKGGTVWAWGANHRGQLGVGRDKAPESCFTPNDGTVNCATHPIRVPGLTGILAVGAGWGHSIALKDDGTVWAWGDTQYGQAGGISFDAAYAPRQINRFDPAIPFPFVPFPLTGITKIAAGYFHNLALRDDGTLFAWGRSNHGQLGNGTFDDSTLGMPVTISTVDDISSKGSHNLALVNGSVWAWGLNAYGQVGDGTTQDKAIPVLVMPDAGGNVISAGMTTSMALNFFRRPYAWGLNASGQLGSPSSQDCDPSGNTLLCRTSPASIAGINSAQVVAAAGGHAIVLRDDDTLMLFGNNASGQLADRSGNFGEPFTQEGFDPFGLLFPLIVAPTGTSISRTTSGTGISLDTLGASIDFGKNAVNSTSSIGLPLENLDPTAITFSSITASGSGFSVADPSGCPTTLPQFGTCTITIYYNPGNVDTHYGTFEILSNAVDNEVLRFGLIGAGVGAPTAPTNVVATAGDGSATVTFDPPSSNGGADITSYTVTACPNGNCTGPIASGSSGGTLVGGLTNGTAYTFVVRATNAVSLTGPNSLPSNSVTPRPSVSSNVVTSSLNPSPYQASVTFTATLAGSLGTPTGTIAFRDGANVIVGCEAITLSSGAAQCTTSALPVGTRSITAQYSGNLTTYSGSTSGAYSQAVHPALIAVTLGASHGAAGFFPVTIDMSQPLGGAVTVDPRTGGSFRSLFFNFNSNIFGADVSITAGQVGVGSTGPNGIGLYVYNVPDNTRVTVTLGNINGTSQTISASMAFLVGDANNSRSVTSADIDAIKSHAGENTVSGNFRHDVNLSGAITAADILAAKGRLNLVVP